MSAFWYACSEPERPTDPFVIWHYREHGSVCQGCQIKLSLVARQHPGASGVAFLLDRVGEFAA